MKTIRVGQLVYWRGQAGIVLELNGFTDAILRMVEGGKTEIANVADLSLNPKIGKSGSKHVFAADKEWDKAFAHFELIRPLHELPKRTVRDVQKVADQLGKSVTTVYRLLAEFEETGLVSSMLRHPRSDKGKSRLSKEVEEIIDGLINKYYLKMERPSVLKLYRRVREECHSLDLIAPTKNTIYSRVQDISARNRISRRFGPKMARERLEPLRGGFPGADFPNAVVQIDHTKVDVNIVDEEHRLPIGRPYLTLCLDVQTKMVTGFLMTLESPSALSAGLCIGHAVSRKDHWLAKRDIQAPWPIYGLMTKIHMDNAKEFHGKMLRRACEQYGIIREHRPKGQPNYGPHIERAFRTFMEECHSLEGTTFSNVQMKLDYDSEGRACMTLAELDLWFTIFIVYCYHHKSHKGINDVAPIQLYNQLVHGSAESFGVGMPAPIPDEEKFRLDFTPYVERTIQRDGVVIDHIKYYSPVLRRWIDAADPGNKKEKQKFIFAVDPRDISCIYFLDPETHTYSRIPYFNSTRPAISYWELKAVLKRIPKEDVNEEMIFTGIRRMRAIEEEAIEKTRLAKQQRATEKRKRRFSERRKGWVGVHDNAEKPAEKMTKDDSELEADDIQPYNDIRLD